MFCKNCGSPLDDNASFCGNCGAKVNQEKAQAEPSSNKETPKAVMPLRQIPAASLLSRAGLTFSL